MDEWTADERAVDEWALLADADGIISSVDLRRAGLTPKGVARMVREQRLAVLGRGWYGLRPASTPEARHFLQTKAQLRAHQGRAVAGHHSGLIVLRLPTYRANLEVVRLNRVTPGSPRTRPTMRLGRCVPADAISQPTVVPALAVVQHGISSGPLSALVAADAALHRGLVTAEELRGAVELVRHHPCSGMVGGFIELADWRRESVGETRLGHAFFLMKLPVTPQFEVTADGFRAVADFKIDGVPVLVEFDGRVKYSRGANEPDPFGNRLPPHEVVWREKVREDRLRSLGYVVVRVIWSDLADPQALARRIAKAIRLAGGRPEHLMLRHAA